jgi:hypothetical protein
MGPSRNCNWQKKTQIFRKNLPKCHFIHQKSHQMSCIWTRTFDVISRRIARKQLYGLNPFQCNLNAHRILPSSFPTSKTAQYNAHPIKTRGLPRNRKSITCAICWLESVLEDKLRTGSGSGAGAQTKTCRASSDIGAEQENHVGRGPT